MIIDYDSIFLEANDMEKSRRFYEKLFSVPSKDNFKDFGMVGFDAAEKGPRIVLRDSKGHGIGQATIWFKVEDVNMVYEELCAEGQEFITEPFRLQHGWAVEFYDPSGNRLGITDCRKDPPPWTAPLQLAADRPWRGPALEITK